MVTESQAGKRSKLQIITDVLINLLLLAIPLGYLSEANGWGSLATFGLFALAIIPLAGWTARCSDTLVERTKPPANVRSGFRFYFGALMGGFGAILDNVSFIILSGVALSQGLTQVVQASIAGAIISNTLFVLGLSFFFGTLLGSKQEFDGKRAKDYAKLLAVIVTAFVLLKFAEVADPAGRKIASSMSVPIAIILILLFFVYIFYEFFHWRRFEDKDAPFVQAVNTALRSFGAGYELKPDQANEASIISGINRALEASSAEYRLNPMGDSSETQERRWPAIVALIAALLGLALALVGTYFVSTELLQLATTISSGAYPVTIAGMSLGTIKFSGAFIGLILIPVIGSAAEHLNSIHNAIQKKTEAAVNNTAGYAVQITLLAAPILVLASALFFGSNFTFDFQPIELAIFGAATFIFYAVTEDGEGTIVEGAALLVVYAIFALATLFFT
jgi:Ca2+:H+ antiporter